MTTPSAGGHPAVKFCGLCRPVDAAAAVAAGAAYVGVILSPGHRRSRTLDEARLIYAAAPGARRVGVFVDADRATLEAARATLALDVLQLHGTEPPELAAGMRGPGVEVWKAVRPAHPAALRAAIDAYAGAVDALLVDGYDPRAAGGTGAPFPLAAVAAERHRLPRGVRLVAAGGLTPENVAGVVGAVGPHVVDVSSGVERVPGKKDAARMRAFVARVRAARTSLNEVEGRA